MRATLVLAALLLAATAAQAGYTDPINSGPTNEKNLIEIFESIYGGSFSGTLNGTSFSNGTVDIYRVADTGGSALDLKSSSHAGFDDRIWSDGITSLVIEAKYAGHGSDFGWSGAVAPLLAGLTSGNAVGQSATVTLSSSFTWWMKDTATGDVWSSDPSLNGGDGDHMVSFRVDDRGKTSWLIAWEDLPLNSSDRDYNDLVIEVTAVPLPPAVWLGAACLGGMALLRYRRRRRQRMGA